ncbi:MAG: DUF2474 domain-containing protein [Caulobacter sp.]|nr:DUF2474 domain-containing protein [Caulobacter sp.]
MPDIIEGPPEKDDRLPPWPKRLMWFALLALGGSLATAIVAYGLRALLKL